MSPGPWSPGPWTEPSREHYERYGLRAIYDNDGTEIAYAITDDYATLIAAAPDLLDCLRVAVADLQNLSDSNGGCCGKTIDAALVAIAKAEGR